MRPTQRHLNLYKQHYVERATIKRIPSVWLPTVEEIAGFIGAKTVIDYGCGITRGLSLSKKFAAYDYDPGVTGFDVVPPPSDLVCCIHTLEHVEPQTLTDTIVHLESLAIKAVLLVVSTEASTKVLPDGSPWHSCVHPVDWWQRLLWKYQAINTIKRDGKEYAGLWIKNEEDV